jgi:bacteriorhodopsin
MASVVPTGNLSPLGDIYVIYQCQSPNYAIGLIFTIIQICVNAVMLLCCLVTVVQIRKVTPRFTEARWLFISVLACCSYLTFLITVNT